MIREILDMKPAKYGLYNELEMLPYFVNKKRLQYIVYGAGNMRKWFVWWAEKVYGVLPEFMVDRTPPKSDMGVTIISLEEFCEREQQDYFVVVAMAAYEEMEVKKQLHQLLREKGAVFICDANIVACAWNVHRWTYIKEHISEFEGTYTLLEDDLSKDTYVRWMQACILAKQYDGEIFPEKYKYWGLENEQKGLFTFKEDEVLLSVGGCLGDTVIQYLGLDRPFEKIIVVEGEMVNADRLQHNMQLLEPHIREKIQIDNYFLGEGENTIDKKYSSEKVSLINMDIEGAELDVLQTGIETIKQERPVMAICAYHKDDDLLKFPSFIKANFQDYVLALRKYPAFLPKNMKTDSELFQQIHEVVLYAIPRERYIG